ncbi:MAG: hypothetical protein QOG01_63 [Pseudonocardiales bacterium]|nr:hypothetical protein [Pseudonocardiales bacterium]
MPSESSQLAAVEVLRAVEAAIGTSLLTAVLVIVVVYLLRSRRERAPAHAEPGIPALARYGGVMTDPTSFGGGAEAARVRRRRDVVSYGYLAVAEEYVSEDGDARWCTLNVTLPGRVPYLVADNYDAVGRPGVPAAAPHRQELDDPVFDATYLVGADEPELIARVLTPTAREVLVAARLQRLLLRDSSVQLRTFDGVELSDDVIESLVDAGARFLASTPSFVTTPRASAGAGLEPSGANPLPEGFYGPDRD